MANTTLKLIFSDSNSLLNVTSRIFRSEITNDLYAFEDHQFYKFEFSNEKWNMNSIKMNSIQFDTSHELRYVFNVGNNRDLLVTVNMERNSIPMFVCDGKNLLFVGEHELDSSDDFIVGRFFNDRFRLVLVTSKSGTNNVNFYEIIINEMEKRISLHRIETGANNLICPQNFKLMSAQLMVNVSREMLICRNGADFRAFQFDANDDELQLVMKATLPHRNGQIFYASLSRHSKWKDLVIFNTNGMFVYSYEKRSSNQLKLINYNPMFSRAKGWLDAYTETVQFIDIDDDDGSDEIIFTGPDGIQMLSFNVYENKWKSLLNKENLTPIERHAKVRNVFKYENRNEMIVSCQSGCVRFASMIEVPMEYYEIPPINEPVSNWLENIFDFPRIHEKPFEESLSTIYLRDQNIWSDRLLLHSINPKTGQTTFSLPLFRSAISKLEFSLTYDGSNRKDNRGVLGMGWSMADNFIISQFQDSNFEEDEYYILFANNIPHRLTLLSENITGNLLIYKAETIGKNARAMFNRLSRTWTLANDEIGSKQFYGTMDNGRVGKIITDSGWKNWRGQGFDEDRNVERVNVWYLGYVKKQGITYYFEYESFGESEVQLKKIYNNRKEEMQFFYGNRYLDYKIGNVNDSAVYLKSYNYQSKTVEQKIQFKYSKMGNSQILTTIEQISDPVMKFTYSEPARGKYVLEKILLPTEVEIIFEYMALGEPMPINQAAAVTRIPLPNETDYNISYGSDFILVSYLDTDRNRIILRMFNNDMSEEMYSSLRSANATKAHWPMLDAFSETIETYQILLGNSYLAIVVNSSPNKFLYLFGRLANDSWQTTTPDYLTTNSDESAILGGNDFILISDPKANVTLLEWHGNEQKWISSVLRSGPESLRSAAVFGNKFVIYDDRNITIGFKDPNNPKKYKQIYQFGNYSGYLTNTWNTLQKFDTKSNFAKALFGFLRNNAIQMCHNLIVLSSLVIHDGKQLAMKIKTFVVGRNHRAAITEDLLIAQDQFENFISSEKATTKDQNFTSKYVSLKGDSKRFLFDFRNYYVALRGQVFKCGNTSYTFGGIRWHHSASSTGDNQISMNNLSIPLGDEFVLRKSTATETVKLLNGREKKILFDFDVENLVDLRVNYPIYIASQAEGKPINLIEFNENGNETSFAITSLPQQQKLTQFSNAISLVTLETSSDRNKTLLIRPMYDGRFLPNFVVKSSKIVIPGETGGSKQRVTGYSYELSSAHLIGDTYVYDQSSVFPGNNKTAHGYVTYTVQAASVFDAVGNLVKNISNADRKNDKTKENYTQNRKLDTILFDENGSLEIANLKPFTTTSKMCGYTGFEDYEIRNRKWIFNENNIIREKNSLTGRNYLHLNSESIKNSFIPEIQDQQFVVSSWIRIPFENLPELGDIVAYLRATVLTESGQEVGNFLSHIKYRLENWSYLEIIVDLQFIRFMLRDDIQLEPKNLKIELRISPSTQFPIDVDNVRFSPLNHIFEVNVYDINRSRPVAVIKSSGAIVRHLYDKYGVRIAEINESNQIRDFVTYTKGSHEGLEGRANSRSVIKLIPEMAFYENFSPNSFLKQWSLEDYRFWSISPGTLHHHTQRNGLLSLKNAGIDQNSCGIRFLYSLQNDSLLVLGNLIELERNSYGAKLSFVNHFGIDVPKIPIEGELLIVKEGGRVFVWIDGDLYFDRRTSPIKTFEFLVQGEVRLQHLMVFSRPQVHVIYKNALNEDIQQISLTSMDSVVVKELLYDEVGRQRITVQPVEVTRKPEESILSYAADLVTNDDPSEINSVWRTGELEGKINRILGHPFGFSEIVFEKNPLNVKSRIGMPGKIFSSSGNYAQRFNSTTANSFLLERYPPRWNFTYHVQSKTSFDEISIYNKENLKVASYIDVEGSRDLFSTFEYNEKGFLVKYLPPMYYNDFGSFDRETHDLTYVPQFNELQEQRLATCISYNDGGHLTRKTTPDTGLVENVYDDDGGKQLRFRIQYSRKNPSDIEAITYLAYDEFGRLVSRGNLREPFPSNQLLKLNISEANAEEYQRFHYSDLERDTAFWGKVLRTITKSQNEELFEESILDAEGNVISKRYVIPTGTDQPMILAINQRFRGGQLQEIMYPASMFGEPFRVAYQYDKLGRMVSVGVPGQPQRFLAITYNANDQVLSETFSPLRQHWFTRNYTYNEPGFPIEIDDPFLRQELSYTDRGYGKHGYADGTVSRTKYTAKWHNSASRYGLGVRSNHQLPPLCYDGLKSEGYLDDNDQQTRIFYQDLEFKLPPACTQDATSADIKRVLGKYGFPKEYGFRFDYGNLMELTKAKYFVGNILQESKPLLHDTFFEEIQNIDMEESQNIWRLLLEWGFISQENGHGKVNKYLLDEILNLSDLGNHEFSTIFKDKRPLIPEIVRLLQKYSATELGQAEFDVQSYEIDANGNHKRFFAGFEHYQLKYEQNSNRIAEVRHQNTADGQDAKVFKMRHDSRGNVIQALHKNIESMEYHPVSNRLQKVTMSDGTTITLQYDARGERVLKRVTNENGQNTREIHYLRDENSRSLVERQVTFMAPDQNPDVLVTMYIYGPNGLIGFVRRDQFYSVISDHLGSVRLVVRDGEVVAAYDYMPYGNLMRIYGYNPDAHISYRFNGQEWDPEFRLYNYHARFYDPVIGRFYQMDPSSQYFSPYKYANNSPVSMVDPNGELAFIPIMVIILFGLLGAYWGGTAANDKYNPADWNWRTWSTYVGIITGGISGALMPVGFSASVAALAILPKAAAQTLVTSIGVSTAYMSVASTNNEWHPSKWNYSAPTTWNSAFQGFSTGVGIPELFYKAGTTFLSLSTVRKCIFGATTAVYGTVSFIHGGDKTNWDTSTPDFWLSASTSIVFAADLSLTTTEILKTIATHWKTFRSSINYFTINLSRLRAGLFTTKTFYYLNIAVREIFKNGGKLLLASAGYGFYFTVISLISGDHSLWDFTQLSTYHNFLMAAVLSEPSLEHSDIAHSAQNPENLLMKSVRGISDSIRTIRIKHKGYESISSRDSFEYRDATAIKTSTSTRATKYSLTVECQEVALLYTHLTNPLFITFASQEIETNSSNIPDHYSNDPKMTSNIMKCINDVENNLENVNLRNFHQNDFVNRLIHKLDLKTSFNHETNCEFANIVNNLFESRNGHLERNQIANEIQNINFENRKSQEIQRQYQKKQRKLDYYVGQHETIEVAKLKKIIRNLKIKENALIADNIRTAVDITWTMLKPYRNLLTDWKYKSYAETAPAAGVKQKFLSNPCSYDTTQDFLYLSFLKTNDLPHLATLDRGPNCLRTTAKTRDKVDDFHWLMILNSDFDRKNRLHFFAHLLPISGETNRINDIELKIQITNNSPSNRLRKTTKKRSERSIAHSQSDGAPSSSSSKTATNASWNLLDFGDNFISQSANNGTLLLTKVLFAKLFKFKFCESTTWTSENSQFANPRIFACEMIELFEKSVKDFAKSNGILMDRLNFSFIPELYKEFIQIFNAKNFQNIHRTTKVYFFQALPTSGHKMLFESFDHFNSNLNSSIDRIIDDFHRV